VFDEVARELGTVLERFDGRTTDIQPLMQNATLAAFTSLSFGERLAVVDEKETDFAVHFNRLTASALTRLQNPFWRLMPWLASERAIRESARYVDALADRVIASSAGKETLLSPFLDLELEPARKHRLLRDVLVNFLVREHVSAILVFSFCCESGCGARHDQRESLCHAAFPRRASGGAVAALRRDLGLSGGSRGGAGHGAAPGGQAAFFGRGAEGGDAPRACRAARSQGFDCVSCCVCRCLIANRWRSMTTCCQVACESRRGIFFFFSSVSEA
jgi:hypothetical protein